MYVRGDGTGYHGGYVLTVSESGRTRGADCCGGDVGN